MTSWLSYSQPSTPIHKHQQWPPDYLIHSLRHPSTNTCNNLLIISFTAFNTRTLVMTWLYHSQPATHNHIYWSLQLAMEPVTKACNSPCLAKVWVWTVLSWCRASLPWRTALTSTMLGSVFHLLTSSWMVGRICCITTNTCSKGGRKHNQSGMATAAGPNNINIYVQFYGSLQLCFREHAHHTNNQVTMPWLYTIPFTHSLIKKEKTFYKSQQHLLHPDLIFHTIINIFVLKPFRFFFSLSLWLSI